MTLIVSTRVPDGIAIAADSLSTLSAVRQTALKGKVTCPSCGNEHEISQDVEVPVGPAITSTLPYAQKLIPLWKRFAVGLYGTSNLGNRTIFSIVHNFSLNIEPLEDPEITCDTLAKHIQDVLKTLPDFSAIPDDKYAVSFQLVGFKDNEPISYINNIGKKIDKKPHGQFGSTVGGETYVCTKLWELKGLGAQLSQPYPAWSLQDAADYSEFLIQATAQHQRFSNVIPTVGGDIDIAVVLPNNIFKWIRRKPLSRLLMEDSKNE